MAHEQDMIDQNSNTIWTEIKDLKNDSEHVNVQFRVIKKELPRRVISKTSGRQFEVADIIVADATARINLVLWNDDIDLVNQGKSFCMLNGSINLRDECMTLSKGRNGVIRELDNPLQIITDGVDMSRPFMGKQKRRINRPLTGRTLNGPTGRETRRYASRKSF